MNKELNSQLVKSLLALLMSCGTKAFAQSHAISKQTLIKSNLDRATVKELLDEKILLRSKNNDELILNNVKIAEVLHQSNDQEVIQFLNWLKIMSIGKTDIKLKKPGGMVFSTQDGGINQGN